VSYLNRSVHPEWVDQAPWARRLLNVMETVFDMLLDASVEAIRSQFPTVCSSEFVASLASENQSFTGPQEPEASFRARIRNVWSQVPYYGTATGLYNDLSALGCKNVTVQHRNGSYVNITNGVATTGTRSWGRSGFFGRSYWERDYWVIVDQPHPFGNGTDLVQWGTAGAWGSSKVWGGIAQAAYLLPVLRTCYRHRPAHANLYEVILICAGVVDTTGESDYVAGDRVLYYGPEPWKGWEI
jgi:hypothetical protein